MSKLDDLEAEVIDLQEKERAEGLSASEKAWLEELLSRIAEIVKGR